MGCVSSATTTTTATTNNKPSSSSRSYPIYGSEKIMARKAHGSSETPVQSSLRWGCDFETADRICNYNRHYAEHSTYWEGKPAFVREAKQCQKAGKTMVFYDSNTGVPLFEAPHNRSWKAFLDESKHHGWPSFRDGEVMWENVRCLKNGECVSLAGTHLGHNLPDRNKKNRYCINLVSVAGKPVAVESQEEAKETGPNKETTAENKSVSPESKEEEEERAEDKEEQQAASPSDQKEAAAVSGNKDGVNGKQESASSPTQANEVTDDDDEEEGEA